ncbi:MAG: site-specific integrase [Nitrospirota bacterium]
MAKGIYKRGTIYWIRYAGLDGKTVYESTGSAKFKEAEVILLNRKNAIKEGKQPEQVKKIRNYTFKELAERYLLWIEGRQKSAQVKGYIIGQLNKIFGALPLRRFNTNVVEQLQTDNINRGVKASTNNKALNVLKHMFTKAAEWDMVETDISKRIHKVKLLRDTSRRLRYLSQEECQELLNNCDSHLYPIVITALNSGMRRGEILSLRWENIDLKHGFILLDITKNGERREIPINNTLRETLQGIERRLDIPFVFYSQNTGKPYQSVKKSFNTACRKSGIKDFHFHDLRHTFASHLVMAGVDITTVKELLGHKTLTMTLRYSHLAPAHKVKAVDILDNAIGGNTNYTKTIQSSN